MNENPNNHHGDVLEMSRYNDFNLENHSAFITKTKTKNKQQKTYYKNVAEILKACHSNL